jgi:hypothetical protein
MELSWIEFNSAGGLHVEAEAAVQSEDRGQRSGVVASNTPPIDVPEVFGRRARGPDRPSINGFPFPLSLMPMGGCHRMPVNRTLRAGAGVKPGDIVAVVMERDDQVRSVDAPVVLKKALGKNKAAEGNWEKLAFTQERDGSLDRGCEAGRDAGSEVSESHAGAGDGNEVDGVMPLPRGLKPGSNQTSLIPSAKALRHPKAKPC